MPSPGSDRSTQPLARRRAEVERARTVASSSPQPLARRAPSTFLVASPTLARRHRNHLPLALKLAYSVLAGALLIGGLFAFLLLHGQTDLIAWLVVGAVLMVVFGTPALCLAGLILLYVTALTSVRRVRHPPSARPPRTAAETPPTIIGEVVFDD